MPDNTDTRHTCTPRGRYRRSAFSSPVGSEASHACRGSIKRTSTGRSALETATAQRTTAGDLPPPRGRWGSLIRLAAAREHSDGDLVVRFPCQSPPHAHVHAPLAAAMSSKLETRPGGWVGDEREESEATMATHDQEADDLRSGTLERLRSNGFFIHLDDHKWERRTRGHPKGKDLSLRRSSGCVHRRAAYTQARRQSYELTRRC